MGPGGLNLQTQGDELFVEGSQEAQRPSPLPALTGLTLFGFRALKWRTPGQNKDPEGPR